MSVDDPAGLIIIAFVGAFGLTALGISLFGTGTGPMIGTPSDAAGLLAFLLVIAAAVIALSRRRG